MTVKEFVGMQSEFAPKRIKFIVDGVPLTMHNFDLLADNVVMAWGQYIDNVIEISMECGGC